MTSLGFRSGDDATEHFIWDFEVLEIHDIYCYLYVNDGLFCFIEFLSALLENI